MIWNWIWFIFLQLKYFFSFSFFYWMHFYLKILRTWILVRYFRKTLVINWQHLIHWAVVKNAVFRIYWILNFLHIIIAFLINNCHLHISVNFSIIIILIHLLQIKLDIFFCLPVMIAVGNYASLIFGWLFQIHTCLQTHTVTLVSLLRISTGSKCHPVSHIINPLPFYTLLKDIFL